MVLLKTFLEIDELLWFILLKLLGDLNLSFRIRIWDEVQGWTLCHLFPI